MDQLETFAKDGKINEEASVKDKQSIVIHAPIDEVWKVVTDIANWNQWNSQVSSAEKLSEEEFTWTLNNTRFNSKVSYSDAPYRFCWVSKGSLLKCVHLYKLDEVDENETSVVFEGSMQGLKTIFSYNHRKLHRSFVTWLDDLTNHLTKK